MKKKIAVSMLTLVLAISPVMANAAIPTVICIGKGGVVFGSSCDVATNGMGLPEIYVFGIRVFGDN